MKLYELTENYQQLLIAAEEYDPETLQDTLDSINEAIEDKVENTVKVLRTLEGNVAALENEIKHLTDMKTVQKNSISNIKDYLQRELEKVGKEKVNTSLFKVRIQNNPPSVKILDERNIPKHYFIQQEPKLDKKTLMQDLKQGTELQGAELQQTRSLRIR